MLADLPICLIDSSRSAVKVHQGHVMELLQLNSCRVCDLGSFVVPQGDRPVCRYFAIPDAVPGRCAETEVVEHVAEADVEPVGECLKP
jgi:hypothetical protein